MELAVLLGQNERAYGDLQDCLMALDRMTSTQNVGIQTTSRLSDLLSSKAGEKKGGGKKGREKKLATDKIEPG